MRFMFAGALALATVVGCSRAGEQERVGAARDTVLTPRRTVDTTIITSDTTVTTDTVPDTSSTVKLDTTRSQ